MDWDWTFAADCISRDTLSLAGQAGGITDAVDYVPALF